MEMQDEAKVASLSLQLLESMVRQKIGQKRSFLAHQLNDNVTKDYFSTLIELLQEKKETAPLAIHGETRHFGGAIRGGTAGLDPDPFAGGHRTMLNRSAGDGAN